MKYLFIFLLALLALLVICGGVGLLAYGWFATAESGSAIPPAPLDPNAGFLPTPTLASSGNGNLVLPPAQATVDPALPAPTISPVSFNGTFAGTLVGSSGSTAPVTLVLTQNGTAVSGNITISDGLTIDAGACGVQAVPATTQQANGQTDSANANQLNANATFEVQGFTVTLNLAAVLAADGNTLTSQATLDLPFPCTDPVINGTFVRQ